MGAVYLFVAGVEFVIDVCINTVIMICIMPLFIGTPV